MKKTTHVGQVCPVVCRYCGSKLIVGKKEFDHLGERNAMGTSDFVYHIMLMCPKRLVHFSFTYFLHDLREFNEDFTVEYKISSTP